MKCFFWIFTFIFLAYLLKAVYRGKFPRFSLIAGYLSSLGLFPVAYSVLAANKDARESRLSTKPILGIHGVKFGIEGVVPAHFFLSVRNGDISATIIEFDGMKNTQFSTIPREDNSKIRLLRFPIGNMYDSIKKTRPARKAILNKPFSISYEDDQGRKWKEVYEFKHEDSLTSLKLITSDRVTED